MYCSLTISLYQTIVAKSREFNILQQLFLDHTIRQFLLWMCIIDWYGCTIRVAEYLRYNLCFFQKRPSVCQIRFIKNNTHNCLIQTVLFRIFRILIALRIAKSFQYIYSGQNITPNLVAIAEGTFFPHTVRVIMLTIHHIVIQHDYLSCQIWIIQDSGCYG